MRENGSRKRRGRVDLTRRVARGLRKDPRREVARVETQCDRERAVRPRRRSGREPLHVDQRQRAGHESDELRSDRHPFSCARSERQDGRHRGGVRNARRVRQEQPLFRSDRRARGQSHPQLGVRSRGQSVQACRQRRSAPFARRQEGASTRSCGQSRRARLRAGRPSG